MILTDGLLARQHGSERAPLSLSVTAEYATIAKWRERNGTPITLSVETFYLRREATRSISRTLKLGALVVIPNGICRCVCRKGQTKDRRVDSDSDRVVDRRTLKRLKEVKVKSKS